jgi:hypothetical protein
MGQTSEMHIALRAEEMATMYEPTFTKKEAIKTGKDLVINMLDSGTVDKLQFMANLARLKEVVNSADAEMRNHLPHEKINVWGVEFTPVNGGNTINYAEDEIYQQLKSDLDARAELLKLAQTQQIIDAYGNDVPKVSTTPRKSSITIKF